MLAETPATKVWSMVMLAMEMWSTVTRGTEMLATEVWAMVMLAAEMLETEARATEMRATCMSATNSFVQPHTDPDWIMAAAGFLFLT